MAIAIYEDLAGRRYWADSTSSSTIRNLARGDWLLYDDTPSTPPPATDPLGAEMAERVPGTGPFAAALRAASVAAVVASGAVATTEALDAAVLGDYDPATLARPAEVAAHNLTALALQAKGGSIGTGGKPVLAIRCDHHLVPLRDTVWPLMAARGLPGSVGVVSRFPTGDAFSTGATWADLRAMARQGLEVWTHSATHSDAATPARLIEEIVTAKAEIEAQGFKSMGWHVAGVGTPTYPDWLLSAPEHFYGPVGRLVQEHHPFSEGEMPGLVQRMLPHRAYHGLGHLTIEAMTVSAIQNTIRQAIAYGTGIQLMLHPGYIGQAGYLTVADLTTVLDFIVARRDAGEIEVLTATGLIVADPGHSRRNNLLGNSSFDPDYALLWTGWSNPTGVSLKTDNGHTGANYVRFTTLGTAKLTQTSSQPYNAGMMGGAFRVEAWMRAPTAAARGTIRVLDPVTPANFDETRSFDITTVGTWQKVWFNTVLHPAQRSIRIDLGRDAAVAADIDMDDITITPV